MSARRNWLLLVVLAGAVPLSGAEAQVTIAPGSGAGAVARIVITPSPQDAPPQTLIAPAGPPPDAAPPVAQSAAPAPQAVAPPAPGFPALTPPAPFLQPAVPAPNPPSPQPTTAGGTAPALPAAG